MLRSKTRVLRLEEVCSIVGLARPTIYWQMRRGIFPQRIQLGPRSVGWLEADIQKWLDERVSARDSASSNKGA